MLKFSGRWGKGTACRRIEPSKGRFCRRDWACCRRDFDAQSAALIIQSAGLNFQSAGLKIQSAALKHPDPIHAPGAPYSTQFFSRKNVSTFQPTSILHGVSAKMRLKGSFFKPFSMFQQRPANSTPKASSPSPHMTGRPGPSLCAERLNTSERFENQTLQPLFR